MKPRVSILDREFKYRDSSKTDVRKTWAEAKKRLEQKLTNVRELTPRQAVAGKR